MTKEAAVGKRVGERVNNVDEEGAKLPVINAPIACARTMLNTSPNAMASFFADVNLWRLLAHSARDRGGVRSR